MPFILNWNWDFHSIREISFLWKGWKKKRIFVLSVFFLWREMIILLKEELWEALGVFFWFSSWRFFSSWRLLQVENLWRVLFRAEVVFPWSFREFSRKFTAIAWLLLLSRTDCGFAWIFTENSDFSTRNFQVDFFVFFCELRIQLEIFNLRFNLKLADWLHSQQRRKKEELEV